LDYSQTANIVNYILSLVTNAWIIHTLPTLSTTFWA